MGNSIGVIAMFKNESHILEEWIKHYINEGVCQFILINNGSTDNFRHILKPYMNTKIKIYLYDDYNRPDKNKENFQINCYNKYFKKACAEPKFKNCGWYIVCDLDEFIYARRGYKKIYEVVKNIPNNVGQIQIPWKMFGSNNHLKQPKSVIKSFDKREVYNKPKHKICCKSIIKFDAIQKLHCHSHILKDGYISCRSDSIGKKYNSKDFILDTSEKIINDSILLCNHYQVQSKEWYLNVKCKRGDAMNEFNGRSLQTFNNLNAKLNEIKDEELKNKKY